MVRTDRRSFLKHSAGAAAALVVAPAVLPTACAASDDAGDAAAADTPAEAADVPATPDGVLADAELDATDLSDVALAESEVVPDAPGTVHAVLGDSLTELYAMGREAARRVGIVPGALEGKTVFIKPNFVAKGMEMLGCGFDPNTGEVTKPDLVAAVAEQCLEAGAAKVTIGDGAQTKTWDWTTVPFVTGNTVEGTTNLGDAATRLQGLYGAERVALECLNEVNDWVPVPSTSTANNVKDGIFVARSFAEADVVISLPVLKTHQWAHLTASMKCYVGVVSSAPEHHGNNISRCKLHLAYKDATCYGVANAGVSGSFVDIHKWRVDTGHEDIAILDATIGLEGNGPHKKPVNDGHTIHLNARNAAQKYFLLAGRDFTAVDATAARIIACQPDDIVSLKMCRNAGLGLLDDVPLVGATLDDLKVSDWEQPVLRGEDYFTNVCPKDS